MTTATRTVGTTMAMEMGLALVPRTPAVRRESGGRRQMGDDRRALLTGPSAEAVGRSAALGLNEAPSIYHRDQPRIMGALLDAYS